MVKMAQNKLYEYMTIWIRQGSENNMNIWKLLTTLNSKSDVTTHSFKK